MKNSDNQGKFQDLLNDYLAADNETRTKAKKKADILNAAEKAGFNKATFKECAKMEKMDSHKRASHILTLMLYARYAGHDGQLDLFEEISTESYELAVADMQPEEAEKSDETMSDDGDTKDIEEFVEEADAEVEAEDDEMSDADMSVLEDA